MNVRQIRVCMERVRMETTRILAPVMGVIKEQTVQVSFK